MEEDSKGTELGNVIRIDDDRIRAHLGKVVRGSVEETLNVLLEGWKRRRIAVQCATLLDYDHLAHKQSSPPSTSLRSSASGYESAPQLPRFR